MEEGDIYRDHEDDLVFRVREIRGSKPESVVAVEVLDEAIETYRTRSEIEEGIDSGVVEPADDVDHEEFEGEDPELPLYETGENTLQWTKYVAAALVVLFVLALAFPAARLFAVLAVKLAVPLGVLAAAAYLGYRYLQEEGD